MAYKVLPSPPRPIFRRCPASIVAFVVIVLIACSCEVAPVESASAFSNLTTLAFDEAYTSLFGGANVVRSNNGKAVRLILDKSTGAGFISQDMYHYGLFSAKIKLPSEYTAGVVVAFYASNGDVFPKNHDELDFEFLGNIRGREWRVQTNVYGNGSTSYGREERYTLWFDPSLEAHRYSILWTRTHIIFFVDDVPIREVVRNERMGGEYPAKPMSLYATIWDGSTWATSGGKYKANYKYAPFVSSFTDLILQGCAVDPIQQVPDKCKDEGAALKALEMAVMSQERREAMLRYRQRFMYYSYCYDVYRYPYTMPECNLIPEEQIMFKNNGDSKTRGKSRVKRLKNRKPDLLPSAF